MSVADTASQYQLPTNGAERGSIPIVRVIARLNVGGPAIQAITLTRLLERQGYRTTLVRGREGPAEGNMDYLAQELGVTPRLVSSMARDPGLGDIVSVAELVRILRAERPHIVHTHAAKGGTIGRLAALLAFPRRADRPVLVHTFHGHSLTGYFSQRIADFYRLVERALARRTDALVAVSPEVRDDLVRLGVATPERFAVVPLGFDLAQFADDTDRAPGRARLRRQWSIDADAEVVTLIARLVPIKRVDRFLRIAALVAADRPQTRFVIVGDGELHEELQASADARALGDRLIWAGFRRDMCDVYAASDVVVLTSDNEGTPVSLIEAQAAAIPVVGADVGGVRAAVVDGVTGLIAPVDSEHAFAGAVVRILGDAALAGQMGRSGREYALRSFGAERLVEDLDLLYRRLLAQRGRATYHF
jgi:glycosyltransferase involved in cell wall biosynthesis